MRNLSAPTDAQYQEQFNKELSEKLKHVRQAQPNHIPVFAMKYKNASKYLIQDLEEPLALFPKKFLLRSVYEIVQKQSLKFSLDKLKEDKKIKNEGENFKLPQFYLYTISTLESSDEETIEKTFKYKSSRPIGKFVRLDLEMTFGEAFEKYGRENVLTIIYTDATEVNNDYNKTAAKIQKWLIRTIVFILILLLIPFLMKSGEQQFDTSTSLQTKSESHDRQQIQSTKSIYSQEKIDSQSLLEIHVTDSEPISFTQGRTFQYDEESI